MPKPIVVRMNWTRMTATNMASFSHNIAAKMAAPLTGKLSDPPASPASPEQMNDAANRLELAYANRLNGPEAKTEFENAQEALDGLLRGQAAWVNTVANGDKTIIEGFGFTATSDRRKKAVVPDTPNAPSISGNAAALHLQTDAVAGADSYCWSIFTGDSTSASVAETHITLSGAAIVIPDGITREILRGVIAEGTKIKVQVLAQNTAGKSGFSSQVSFTVGS